MEKITFFKFVHILYTYAYRKGAKAFFVFMIREAVIISWSKFVFNS